MAMNFRPPDELAVRLRRQAEDEHTSVQAVLVKAAEEYLLRHNKRRAIDEALGLILVESADAIKRLGQ
jgi:predicted transcriptional regulator